MINYTTYNMKSFFKRLSKTKGFLKIVCWLIAGYIRLVYYTSRVDLVIDEAAKPYMEGKLPAIFAFWHGRLLMMPMICPPKRKMHVLISTHRDGELIARTMHNFNFGTIRGSSTRGGGDAAMKTVKFLQAGHNVSITPDGPKGPAMKVQPGITGIASLADMPVIGVTYAASHHKRINSWDRFMLAYPFSQIHYRISAPLMSPTKEELENVMIEMTDRVDEDAGV